MTLNSYIKAFLCSHLWLVSILRPYYGQVTSPDLYPANNHLMGPPDVYPPSAYLPRPPNDQHTNYLPSVSYSLDHLDRLDYQVTSGPAPSPLLTVFP